MNIFSTLANFNPWVNGHIYDAAAKLPDENYRMDCGVFFKSVHHTLNHILVVDRLWFARAKGTTADVKSLDQILYDDFASLREERMAEDNRIVEFVADLDEQDLVTVVPFVTTDGTAGEMSRDLMLMTVFNHQTHHRGQVTAMLSKFGIDYGSIDLPYYLRTL